MRLKEADASAAEGRRQHAAYLDGKGEYRQIRPGPGANTGARRQQQTAAAGA